jgi:hypothetical protein
MQDIKRRVYELAKKHKSAVNVEILADTLFYRLTIIRLGEEDNNMWWESCILGEVGRRNLEKFFPNTFYKQRYDIARKIIVEKENREIPEKRFITLFNFGYEFESKIFTPFIKEVTYSDGWQEVLDMIENIKEEKFTSPWAREFFNLPKLPVYTLNDKKAIELGSISETFYRNKESFEDTIKSFISIYDLCTIGRVVIPYYKRRMAI